MERLGVGVGMGTCVTCHLCVTPFTSKEQQPNCNIPFAPSQCFQHSHYSAILFTCYTLITHIVLNYIGIHACELIGM